MEKPNYTQTPNVFYDEIMSDLGYAELKCILYIFRRTFGFHKQSDKISLTQFEKGIEGLDKGTGLGRKAIVEALKSLEQKGYIKKNKGRITSFSMILGDELLVSQGNQTSVVKKPKGSVARKHTKERERKVYKTKRRLFLYLMI